MCTYIHMEIMERRLDECTLNCGHWNVIGNAGEKGLSLLLGIFKFCTMRW